MGRSHTKALEGPKTPSRQVIITTEALKCPFKNNTSKVLHIWLFLHYCTLYSCPIVLWAKLQGVGADTH